MWDLEWMRRWLSPDGRRVRVRNLCCGRVSGGNAAPHEISRRQWIWQKKQAGRCLCRNTGGSGKRLGAARTQKLPGLEKHQREFPLGWNRKVVERRPEVARLVKALQGMK